ncbi:hypothetical protein Fmac_015893 [Flemingia macrophylla]|uniref:Uncharacterized protein n=1 Tax=Flemingia macrophylla TaxID=520843 RepID=A0ABD1MFU9_9FABA
MWIVAKSWEFCLRLQAKNLILAGVKSVTLHDEGNVEFWDLSGNSVFSENHICKNRTVSSVSKLQELNNVVFVLSLTTELTKQHLSSFQTMLSIATSTPVHGFSRLFVVCEISKRPSLNEGILVLLMFWFNGSNWANRPLFSLKLILRKPLRSMITATLISLLLPLLKLKLGAFGVLCFVILGLSSLFLMLMERIPIIASISNDNRAPVSCVDDEWLQFQDGDFVVHSEVHGQTTKGLNSKPLRGALSDPGDFLLSDFSKFDRTPQLHLALQALDMFVSDMGRVRFAGLAVLNPMAAMFGGIVGQEVVKTCSGKCHPLFQGVQDSNALIALIVVVFETKAIRRTFYRVLTPVSGWTCFAWCLLTLRHSGGPSTIECLLSSVGLLLQGVPSITCQTFLYMVCLRLSIKLLLRRGVFRCWSDICYVGPPNTKVFKGTCYHVCLLFLIILLLHDHSVELESFVSSVSGTCALLGIPMIWLSWWPSWHSDAFVEYWFLGIVAACFIVS